MLQEVGCHKPLGQPTIAEFFEGVLQRQALKRFAVELRDELPRV